MLFFIPVSSFLLFACTTFFPNSTTRVMSAHYRHCPHRLFRKLFLRTHITPIDIIRVYIILYCIRYRCIRSIGVSTDGGFKINCLVRQVFSYESSYTAGSRLTRGRIKYDKTILLLSFYSFIAVIRAVVGKVFRFVEQIFYYII